MSDLNELERLAQAAISHAAKGCDTEFCEAVGTFRSAANPQAVLEMLDRVRELEKVATQKELLDLQTIDERDSAEQALAHAYFLITGKSPEWSNLFGHAEALNEIDDAQRCLRAEADHKGTVRLTVEQAQMISILLAPGLLHDAPQTQAAKVNLRETMTTAIKEAQDE